VDLAIANFSERVTVLFGNGDGSFQPRLSYVMSGASLVSLALADFDGDGWLDIAAADGYYPGARVFIIRNAANWPPLPIGDGLRRFGIPDIGEAPENDSSTAPTAQIATVMKPMDASESASVQRPRCPSRTIARLALSESRESEFAVLSAELT
jgi:hypothetical protein